MCIFSTSRLRIFGDDINCILLLTEIRPYMFEILMFLVNVHSHVASVSKSLLERTLNALVEEVAEEALRCFRKVKKFGMGGMLRVRFYSSC